MKRFLFIWFALLLLAPILPLANPSQTDPSRTLEAPSSEHLLGTDNAGRDVLSRVLLGGQRSILTATLAASIAIIPALILGILAGINTRADTLISILLNTFLAFPALLLALVVLTLLGRGLLPIAIATGLAQLAFYARLVRTLILQSRQESYVLAAEALGATPWQILRWHLLPSSQPQLFAYASVTWAYCLINSSALSLLGLGTDPSLPDWGVMLATGRETFRHAPWAVLAPAIALIISVSLVNKLADELGNS